MLLDPDRNCELCGGPLLIGSQTGICRSNRRCMQESDSRTRAATVDCKICGSPLGSRNKIGICRTNEKCSREAKKVHDRVYHQSRNGPPREIKEPKHDNESYLLPDDELVAEGYVDPVAVRVTVTGLRKVRLTHIERVEVVRCMLALGAGVREMCENLHVSPAVVRLILDELGYECVRNTHIAGSKIMVILPKNRPRQLDNQRLPR